MTASLLLPSLAQFLDNWGSSLERNFIETAMFHTPLTLVVTDGKTAEISKNGIVYVMMIVISAIKLIVAQLLMSLNIFLEA